MERHSCGLLLPDPSFKLRRYYIVLLADFNQRLPPTLQLCRRIYGGLSRRPTRSSDTIPLERHRHAHLVHRMDDMFSPQQRDRLQARRVRRYCLCFRRLLPLRHRLDALTLRVPYGNISLLASLEGPGCGNDVRLRITYYCIILQSHGNGELGMEVLYCVLCLSYGNPGYSLFLFPGDEGSYAGGNCCDF